MQALKLSNQQARRFILAYQGLASTHIFKGKAGVLSYIRQVNCVQFDPLNIVGHNPHLVLQARVADFRPAMLQTLLYADRVLLDAWDKMMSIYCVADWPYFRRNRERALRRFGQPDHPVMEVLPLVRQALEERGPLSSIDLDFDQTVNWSWAPTRLARAVLESMYSWGELIVHHKVNTRKVYDFAHRHISADVLSAAEPNPTAEQFEDWYVYRRVGSLGLLWDKAGDAWLGSGVKSSPRKASLARLLEQDKLIEVHVAGIKYPLYIQSQSRALLAAVLNDVALAPRAAIIAPLDNLIWDRRFAEALFEFSYRWEVYKPAAERQYGYYVLPVLYGDRFVARFEPGHDKKNGTLLIKQWWWESGCGPSAELNAALGVAFERFLGYLGAQKLQVAREIVEKEGLSWAAKLC